MGYLSMKQVQVSAWAFLGLGVLLSYVALVLYFYPNVGALWYGTPPLVQKLAYFLWALAAIGTITYAIQMPYSGVRFGLGVALLVLSIAWSYCMILSTAKPVTAGVLIATALCSGALLVTDLVQKEWWGLVLIPLFLVNGVVDGVVLNAHFLTSTS